MQGISTRVFMNRNIACVLALSTFVFLGSIISESLLDFKPCKFCNFQRIGFLLLSVISIVGIFISEKKLIGISITAVSVGVFSLACYQLAIQFGFFSDPCIVSVLKDFDEFKNAMINKVSPCSGKQIIAGIPLSAWSAIFSFICFLISLRIAFLPWHVRQR